MAAVLGLAFLLVCAYYAKQAIQDASSRSRSGTRPARLRAPQGRARSIRQAGPGAWQSWNTAWSANWLEKRQHRRANGTTAPRQQRRSLPVRMRLKPRTVTQPAQTTPPAGGNGTGAPPARPSPAPQPPRQSTSNGGTPMPSRSTASGEKITEGANELHQHAANGNINAKVEALAGAEEGANRFSGTMEMLGRTMSEPDNRYGPEITEPIIKAGAQLHAAAILISEGRANLESLANMSVRDLADSSRQAPHHSELSENGSH